MNRNPLLSCFLGLSLAAGSANAAISYAATGLVVLQDFNALPATGTTPLTGTGTTGNQIALPGVTGWEIARVGGTAVTDVTLNTAQATGGRFYSRGNTADERALTMLGSATFAGGAGTGFVNDTGAVLTSFTVSYFTEIWAVQGTGTATPFEDRLRFSYGLAGGGPTATNFITSATMTPVPALDAVSPASNTITGTVSGDDPNRGRDGNAGEWRSLVSATVSDLTWQPGATLYLRWNDSDSSGFDASMGIDDVRFSAVPEPTALSLTALGLGWAARRRRPSGKA